MQIDMGDSETVLQRPYPIDRSEINKLLDAGVIHNVRVFFKKQEPWKMAIAVGQHLSLKSPGEMVENV